MDLFVPLLFLGVPLGYLVLQLRALRRWQGTFRNAAALPLLAWLVWGMVFALDVTRDPSSRNLFPFEVLLGALFASAYLGVLAGVRRLVAREDRVCGLSRSKAR